MIILVASLKEGKPEPVVEELDAKEIDVEFSDLQYLGKIKVDGTVEKSMSMVTFKATLNRNVRHSCARCLSEVDESLSGPVEFNYDASNIEEIDTLPDIRDELILSHPDRFLCKEDCKGLCPNCGTNLNTSKCKCSVNPSQNAFSKLSKLKKEKNKSNE